MKELRECKVKNCSGNYYSKGYCEKHYQQVRKHSRILERTVYDPNEIVINDDAAEIILCDQTGKEAARAIIDINDVEKVKNYKWHIVKREEQLVPAATINKRSVYLSNFIMEFKPSGRVIIDHKDRKPLNCRKHNLRKCTMRQNTWNRGISKNNTSGHKGVSWDKNKKKWDARITVNEKQIFIGAFNDLTVAAEEYNEAARKHYGRFAYA